jgi:hypothetical protein
MDLKAFQGFLNGHGASIVEDGAGGPATRAAIKTVFSNTAAPAVTDADIVAFAERLQCSVQQIKAVATVESSGGGFTDAGQPKILFERHYFHRLTNGRFPTSPWNNVSAGGYREMDSWKKLAHAACLDPLAALASASWGKFQVMGQHAEKLGWENSLAMAYSMVKNEAAHYEALVRYVWTFGLTNAIRRLSTNPADNEAFAKGYNGPGFRQYDYHVKLARAMG